MQRGVETVSPFIYPGTFDPITNGHVDIARRACGLFGPITFAIAVNTSKTPFFDIAMRIALAQRVFQAEGLPVGVLSFEGLLVDFVSQHKGRVIIRGLRAISDYEHELQLANTNRVLLPTVETLFLTPAVEYAYISSTMVREIAGLGGDVSALVHPLVRQQLQQSFALASR